MAGMRDIYALTDERPAFPASSGAPSFWILRDASKTDPGRLRGAVTVDNLTFRYRTSGPMVLDGISIRAEPGECIALTGPSGSGKSTLLNLILRFETPHSGAIYLDGRDPCGSRSAW